jgi:hypothetical protein
LTPSTGFLAAIAFWPSLNPAFPFEETQFAKRAISSFLKVFLSVQLFPSCQLHAELKLLN